MNILNKILYIIAYFVKKFFSSLDAKDYCLLFLILFFLCCKFFHIIYSNIESYQVYNLIKINKDLIEKQVNFKKQIGYDSIKDSILISNDTYLVSFKEKDYRHYQLQVVKKSKLSELKNQLDNETNVSRKKHLMDLYKNRRVGTQYYYRDQSNFLHICYKSDIECQRYYF